MHHAARRSDPVRHGITLGGGVSDLLTTDERARTLILHKGQEVVARIPLHLRPGEVNEIHY